MFSSSTLLRLSQSRFSLPLLCVSSLSLLIWTLNTVTLEWLEWPTLFPIFSAVPSPIALGTPLVHPMNHTREWFASLLNSNNEDDYKFTSYGYSNDPLPMCSSIHPNLTIGLLKYKKYVHDVYMNAKCASINECIMSCDSCETSSTTPFPSRFLYFYVSDEVGSNGGLADRYKGLFSTFLLALITLRGFGLQYNNPKPFKHVMTNNILNWPSEWPPLNDDNSNKINDLGTNHTINYMMVSNPLGGNDHNHKILLNDSPFYNLIRVQSNMNFVLGYSERDYSRSIMKALGLTKEMDLDLLYSCLFQYLFHPAVETRKLINPLLKIIKPSASPLDSPQGPLASDSQNKGDPCLLCAQIRMGSSNKDVTWKDSEQFTPFDSIVRVIQTLKTYIVENNLNEQELQLPGRKHGYYVFLTADAEQVINEFKTAFGDNLMYIQGPIVHVDRSKPSEGALGFAKTVGDHYMLGECQFAIISDSGFGSLGVWRRRLPHSQIKVIHRNGEIKDYIHERWGKN